MKPKKYTESKIKAADKFLSKYGLSFDALDEQQKIAVVRYCYPKKILWFAILGFSVGCIACLTMAYLLYTKAHAWIESKSELFLTPFPFIEEFGNSSFIAGFFVAIYTFTAFLLFIYIIVIPFDVKWRGQVLNAFLPSLKQKQASDNEQVTSN